MVLAELLRQFIVLFSAFFGLVTSHFNVGTLWQQPKVVDDATQSRQSEGTIVNRTRGHRGRSSQQEGGDNLTGEVRGEHNGLQVTKFLTRKSLEHQWRHNERVENRTAEGHGVNEAVVREASVKTKSGDEQH